MDITLKLSRPTLRMHKTWPIIAVVGVVAIAIYLWAFISGTTIILTVGGVASLLILLLLPVVTTYVATNSAIKEIKTSKRILPVSGYVNPTLQRLAVFLAIETMIAIPIAVIFYLYFQLYANGVFMGVVNCVGASCAAFLPGTALQQAPLVLLIAIGLWGLNVLACVLAVRLAIRGWDFIETLFGTVIALVVVVVVMFELFTSSKFTQWYLIVIAAVLPYALAYAIAVIQPRTPGIIAKKRR